MGIRTFPTEHLPQTFSPGHPPRAIAMDISPFVDHLSSTFAVITVTVDYHKNGRLSYKIVDYHYQYNFHLNKE